MLQDPSQEVCYVGEVCSYQFGYWVIGLWNRTMNFQGEKGMQWSNLNDESNGLKDVLVILFVEWVVFMLLTFYLDQVAATESGINKHPLFFLNFKRKAKKSAGGRGIGSRQPSARSKSLGQINVENGGGIGDRQDVAREVSIIPPRKPLSLSLALCNLSLGLGG